MTSPIRVKTSRNLLPAAAGVTSLSQNVITTLLPGRNPKRPLGNRKYL